MSSADQNREAVLRILESLNGLDPLKSLFWSELNYERVNQPLSRRGWNETAANALDEDPILFAAGGEGNDFHVIYGRLASDCLLRGLERPVVSRLLSQHPYSLFVFSNRQQDHWHFLNTKYDEDTAKRQLFRRITVGPEERLRTACERLAMLDLEDVRTPSPLAIQDRHDDAFDVEKVQKEFFRTLDDIYKKSVLPDIQRGEKDEANANEAGLILLNRILFLYFVQKKGWLEKRYDYLAKAFQDYRTKGKSAGYYSEFLWPLFQALYTPKEDRDSALAQFKRIPFLNGGLFEPQSTISDADLKVTNATFARLFDELLERYNFTVAEDTPLDIEVAVDPEMLGKIFEELVTGRHSTGAYYTPRPVVDFMSREALKGYLGGGEAVEKFVDEHDARDLSDPEATLDRLRSIKVCDPACGSGAYLVGMLHELVALRQSLFASRHVDRKTKTDYDRKLEIIQNNLYGVDSDAMAVNIARLRLWLSLSVEYEGEKGTDPPALPNLDFKIEREDSLLGPDPSGGPAPDMFRMEQIERYDALKAEYQQTNIYGNKGQLLRKISALRREITEWAHPGVAVKGFDWRVEFAEVFNRPRASGFDIVLANPPYVRQELIGGQKGHLLQLYADVAEGKSDLYCYFYARGLQLVRLGGMHVFVCSNSWLDVGYGGKLQRYLLENAHVLSIFDSAVERQFSTSDINTIISVVRKGKPPDEATTRFISLRAPFLDALADPKLRKEVVRTRLELWQAGLGETDKSGRKGYTGNKWGGKYLRAPDIYWTILEKGKGKLVRLGDIAEVRRGFTTGANKFFYLDAERIRQWGIEEEFLKPVIKSPRECKRILIDPKDLKYKIFMCHKEKKDLKGTAALQYIKWGEAQEFHKRPSCRGRVRWWEAGEEKGNSLFVKEANETSAVFFNPQNYPADCRLYCADLVHSSFLFLNSPIAAMMFEIYNRAGLGEGARSLMVSDYADVPCLKQGVHPEKASDIMEAISRSSPRNLRTPQERKWETLDTAIFDVLGLTRGEREAVYEALIELVESRLKKADSLSPREQRKRSKPISETVGNARDVPDEESSEDE